MTRVRTLEESRRDYATLKKRVGQEEINRRSREWARNNPERARANLARSRKSNPARKLWNSAKARCKKSGLEFSISREDIIIPEYCPLLNAKLSVFGHKDYCPSLDRKDNSKGYTPDNIWVISFKANRMKNTATWDELKTFAANITRM